MQMVKFLCHYIHIILMMIFHCFITDFHLLKVHIFILKTSLSIFDLTLGVL